MFVKKEPEPGPALQQHEPRLLVLLWCVDCSQHATAKCADEYHDTRELRGYRRRLAATQVQALEQLEQTLGAAWGLEQQVLKSVQLSSEQCGQLLQRVRDCKEGLRAGREPWDQLLHEAQQLLQSGVDQELEKQLLESQGALSLRTQDWQADRLQLQEQPLLRLGLRQLRRQGVLQPRHHAPVRFQTAVQATVDSLPDELLALVFSYLGAEAVLRVVRAVCKRWRGVALCPTVWSSRTILADDAGHVMTVTRVLELAPCARKLVVGAKLLGKQPGLRQLMLTTGCAVSSLALWLDSEQKDVNFMAKILMYQVARGRLQELCVSRDTPHVSAREIISLVANLNLHVLDYRTMFNCDYSKEVVGAPSGRWGSGSVERLTFTDSVFDPVLYFLVSARACTLKDVTVYSEYDKGTTSVPGLNNLAACVNLERACLPFVSEVGSLASCPRLTHLRLWIHPKEDDAGRYAEPSAAIAAFLEGAAQLKQLKMVIEFFRPKNFGGLVMDAVEAAASCGVPRLEELAVPRLACPDEMNRLLAALPQFPRLTTLELDDAPSYKFLRSLNPTTAPKLTLLIVNDDCQSEGSSLIRCLVETVLRNVELHALAVCKSKCVSCLRFPLQNSRRLGYYSHSEQTKCSLHDPAVNWFCVEKLRKYR